MVTSPPAWWCGLKSNGVYAATLAIAVTTCVVVWIEIYGISLSSIPASVTTCVVVWIEIPSQSDLAGSTVVTTCVVVWIEIPASWPNGPVSWRHHLRGGVD
mgnify:CR=1 FL=1